MNRYFLVYKPFQVLCQFSPQDGKQTLADYFKVPADIYPVGRLDYDSEGLLLLTNDKSLNHRLLHPVYQHERSYWVQVEGLITQEAAQHLQHGITIHIDGKPHQTRPCKATLLTDEPFVAPRNPPVRFRKNIPTSWLNLTLTEGKNRQVRRMTAHVGFPTLRLIRHSIVGLQAGNMQPGEMIELTRQIIYRKLQLQP